MHIKYTALSSHCMTVLSVILFFPPHVLRIFQKESRSHKKNILLLSHGAMETLQFLDSRNARITWKCDEMQYEGNGTVKLLAM